MDETGMTLRRECFSLSSTRPDFLGLPDSDLSTWFTRFTGGPFALPMPVQIAETGQPPFPFPVTTSGATDPLLPAPTIFILFSFRPFTSRSLATDSLGLKISVNTPFFPY